jgi:hypothetical protein
VSAGERDIYTVSGEAGSSDLVCAAVGRFCSMPGCRPLPPRVQPLPPPPDHNRALPCLACVQGDDVDILIITKEGIKLDKLELKRD